MDLPHPTVQNAAPTTQPSGFSPNLDPQLLEIIRQAQAKAVQEATAQVKQQFDSEWERRKKMVDDEWNKREAAYRKQLEDAQAALHARTIQQGQATPSETNQSQPPQNQSAQANIEDHPMTASNEPESTRAGPSTRPLRTPLPSRLRPPSTASTGPIEGTPQRGRQLFPSVNPHTPSAPRHSRRHNSRSESPLARRQNRPPRSPTRTRQTAQPANLDGDVDMEQDDERMLDVEDEGSDEEDSSIGNRRQLFQLKSSDLPKDIKGFKDAFIMHLRVLWRLLHPNSIPQDPTPEAIERFNRRFRSAAAVNAQRRSGTLLTNINNVRGAAMIAESLDLNSKIVRTVVKMEENIVQYMDSSIARVGLEEWGPDFSQSPHALYNSTNRIIALDTFKQAVTSHAYASLKPNLKFVNDMDLLIKLYNHFVHFFFYRRYIRERQNPGIIAQEDEANPMYRNRSRLAKARAEWLRQNGYPNRYIDLCIPKATSDDERDPEGRKISGRPVFFIRTRPERSNEVTRFFRLLDAARERDTRLDPSRRWVERVRIEPAEPIETAFPSIPLHMPVDYFDPDFFNELQPNLQAKAANQSVSLLPDVDQSFTRCDDERLSDVEFNDKYAAERLPNYDLFDDGYADDEGEDEGEGEHGGEVDI